VGKHLSFGLNGKVLEGNSIAANPAYGGRNPTVRDERGACGNVVSHGGIRNPLHRPKGCMMETLHLKLSAPYFYQRPASLDIMKARAKELRNHQRRK